MERGGAREWGDFSVSRDQWFEPVSKSVELEIKQYRIVNEFLEPENDNQSLAMCDRGLPT